MSTSVAGGLNLFPEVVFSSFLGAAKSTNQDQHFLSFSTTTETAESSEDGYTRVAKTTEES